MSKYTPAPWSAERVWDIPETKVHAYCCGKPYALAEVYAMPGAGEREANAKLIAAAPELLAAAQAAWNCIGELPPTQARVEVGQMLTAAIAKATGEA